MWRDVALKLFYRKICNGMAWHGMEDVIWLDGVNVIITLTIKND